MRWCVFNVSTVCGDQRYGEEADSPSLRCGEVAATVCTQVLHTASPSNRLVFLTKETLPAFVWWFDSFFTTRVHGAKACFFEKDASQKAKQREVE